MAEDFIDKLKTNYTLKHNYLKNNTPKALNTIQTQNYRDNKRRMKRGGPKKNW